ncbi:hypothetical protein [Sphingosinicella sp. BN140058]|uniref:hypothetical protein n=1 Tax=Sphingosinicella sp. BN140058 TaxID=1892855 RepID=UPI0013EDF5A0|nr:hypothetical protein [Sphingosinicella sp. BN140058]
MRVIAIDGGPYSLHPDDEAAFDTAAAQLPPKWEDLGRLLIGTDCARAHGVEWTTPID